MGLLDVAYLLPLDKLIWQGRLARNLLMLVLGGFSLVNEMDYLCLLLGHICRYSIYPSIHSSIQASIHPPSYPPFPLPNHHLPIHLPTHSPIQPSIHPSIHPSTHSTIHPLPIYPLLVHPSMHLSIHPFTHSSSQPAGQPTNHPTFLKCLPYSRHNVKIWECQEEKGTVLTLREHPVQWLKQTADPRQGQADSSSPLTARGNGI